MNKKKKVRHSGKLKSYMQWPAVVAVLLVMLDILVFAIDVKAGFLVFCFTAAYWVLMSVLMLRYRPFVLLCDCIAALILLQRGFYCNALTACKYFFRMRILRR